MRILGLDRGNCMGTSGDSYYEVEEQEPDTRLTANGDTRITSNGDTRVTTAS